MSYNIARDIFNYNYIYSEHFIIKLVTRIFCVDAESRTYRVWSDVR